MLGAHLLINMISSEASTVHNRYHLKFELSWFR
jgi:hypothetical protein